MTDSDSCVPKVLTDFVFDLYDSVSTAQLTEEQVQLYSVEFRELSNKYFGNQPWPSPQSIAAECNGDPLFLAVYRELTHRHLHSVSRPTIRDRVDGWQVYREFFEEILEGSDFFLIPSWCFDILNEFVYQFQGYCQIRSAVYASARKQGLLNADGTVSEGGLPKERGSGGGPSLNLMENLATLQNSKEAWDAESVFSYLHRLVKMGLPQEGKTVAPVYSYLSLFASVALSRLECLLGDYTACLQALTPIVTYENYVIPKDEDMTIQQVLHSVVGARLSLAYHAGVSFLMLRRYKDAMTTLGEMCAFLQRGFKTGQLRKLTGSEQFNKQYDRMLSLLAILTHVCPAQGLLEDSVVKAIREKYAARLESASSYEEFFMSPKFVSTDPMHGVYRQQVQLFLKEMEVQPAGRKLRSYLKLYTSLPVDKLAKFYDRSTEDFLPLILSYKARMRQLERPAGGSYIDGQVKSALDIHYYMDMNNVHIDEAEKTRRFENYFVAQIMQNSDIRKEAVTIETDL